MKLNHSIVHFAFFRPGADRKRLIQAEKTCERSVTTLDSPAIH